MLQDSLLIPIVVKMIKRFNMVICQVLLFRTLIYKPDKCNSGDGKCDGADVVEGFKFRLYIYCDLGKKNRQRIYMRGGGICIS